MKKIFTLLVVMMMGICGWATDITITPADFTPADNSDYSVTKDGITVAVVASTVTADQMRIYKGKTMTISSTVGNISKIVFTCTASGEAKYGPGSFNAQDGYSFDGTTGTWEGSAAEVVFTAEKNQVRATQIVVTVGEGGNVDTRKATTIEFADGYETRATCGKDESIKLPSAMVMAGEEELDDRDVTWSLSSDDIAQLEGKNIKISDGVQGQVTVKADFAGDNEYKPSTKSYTLTIYKGYMLLSSLVEDCNSTNPKWDNGGEYASYWFVNENRQPVNNTVTYANGKYIYVTDGTNNMLFYGTNKQNLAQGHVINGDLGEGKLGAFWGKLYRYNKLPEFSFTDMEVKIQDSVAVAPKAITVSQLADNLNAYIQISNAEFVSASGKNLKFVVGTDSMAVYNQFNVDTEALEVGELYTLTGMGYIYKETLQINLIDFTAGANNITSMKADAMKSDAIYNLQGQRMMATKKGLYIINGKKVVK
jgi:hypothetical protein